MTNTPFPFSNLGIVHPAFIQGDLRTVVTTMRQNIAQVDTYLHRYCEETNMHWCESELKSFEKELHLFDQGNALTEADKVKQIVWMSEFMNEKYEHFKSIWIEFDVVSMQLGAALALYLIAFHQTVSFGRSQHF